MNSLPGLNLSVVLVVARGKNTEAKIAGKGCMLVAIFYMRLVS